MIIIVIRRIIIRMLGIATVAAIRVIVAVRKKITVTEVILTIARRTSRKRGRGKKSGEEQNQLKNKREERRSK